MLCFSVASLRPIFISILGLLLVGNLSLSAHASTIVGNPIDNTIWTSILQRHVDPEGLFDYKRLLNDRESFDKFISSIQQYSPDSHPELFPTPSESLAYYINAYNASVVNGVLSRGPEKESVWKGWISGLNFFVRMKITLGGKTTNLKALEDDIVRARFKDPRIHAALNCASIGCPRLIPEAYTAEHLERQLDAAVTEFLNGEMHVRVDDKNQQVLLSKIFDWYEKDFLEYESRNGNTSDSENAMLIDYVNRYRSADDQIPNTYTLKFLKYDKRINQKP